MHGGEKNACDDLACGASGHALRDRGLALHVARAEGPREAVPGGSIGKNEQYVPGETSRADLQPRSRIERVGAAAEAERAEVERPAIGAHGRRGRAAEDAAGAAGPVLLHGVARGGQVRDGEPVALQYLSRHRGGIREPLRGVSHEHAGGGGQGARSEGAHVGREGGGKRATLCSRYDGKTKRDIHSHIGPYRGLVSTFATQSPRNRCGVIKVTRSSRITAPRVGTAAVVHPIPPS